MKRTVFLAAALFAGFQMLACESARESRIDEVRELHDAGRHGEAIEPLRELLAEDPEDLELNHLYGVALLVTGRPSMAVWPLRKASLSDEFAVRDGSLLARALLAGGSPEDAVAAASRVLEVEPDNVEMLRLRLDANVEAMRNEDALADVEEILALEPDDIASRISRVKALLNLNLEEDADVALKELAEKLEQIDEEDTRSAWLPRICGASASFADERGDPEGAEVVWIDCVAKYPEENIILLNAVEFFDSRGQHGQALEILRSAQTLRPNDMQIAIPLASRLEVSGRRSEAEAILEQAAEADPEDIQTWLSIANYYDEQDNPQRARDAVRKAMDQMREAPIDLVAAYAELLIRSGDYDQVPEVMALLEEEPMMLAMLQGRMDLALGRPEEALAQFEEGLRLWPSNTAARYLAGQASEQLGKFDSAITQYVESHRADHSNKEAALRVAALLEGMGRGNEALPILNRYLLKNPNDSEAWLTVLRIASRMGVQTSVARSLRALEKQPRQQATLLVELAQLREEASGLQAATTLLESSGIDFTRLPNAVALDQLVRYLAQLDRSAEGLALAEVAVKARPRSARMREIYGRALRASGAAQPARKALERALNLDPNWAPAVAELGLLTAEQGNSEEAIALFDRAAELDPDEPDHVWQAVQLVAASGNRDEAQRRLEELVRHHGTHTPATQQLALWVVEENPDQALKLAKQAIRFRGGPDALETLGRVHLERGNTAKATQHFERALELRPDSSGTHFWLGQAQAAAGNTEEARLQFLAALEDPSFEQQDEARAALAELKSGT